jgi:hypothetical protein
MQKILLLLTLCISLAAGLLFLGPDNHVKEFSSEQLFEEFIFRQVYDFGYPHERVRTQEVRVNDRFSRQIITVDVNGSFPKTKFHRNLADSLRSYGVTTYAVVQMSDPVTEIHLSKNQTVLKTIRLIRSN